MSMTLILWKRPVVDDPDDAEDLLKSWYETGDDKAFEQSGDLEIVHDELLRQYPMDWGQGADPWADGPDNTGRLLVLSIRWGGDGRILADVVALARKLDLVLYDPQGPDVFLPTDPLEELTQIPRTGLVGWLRIMAMVAGLSALTYAAWLIPIGWIRWPAVIIAGFIAAAAWFVLWLMIFGPDEEKPGQASKS
jgi:hypothetical protein